MSKKIDLGNTYEESYNSRGGASHGACNWSKVNGSVKFYKAKENVNKLAIVPYEIKSSIHPLVKAGKRSVGDYAYNMDIWVHRKVGPGEATVICPSKTYGKPCPLCEAADKAYKDNNQEAAKAFKAARRVYYNVIDMSDPEEGLQVFDVSHYLFEKELIGAASRKGENGQMVRFADPDNKYGRTIKFYGEKEKLGTSDMMKFKDFDFVERKVEVGDFVDKAISFDELITVPKYEDIMALMNGTDEEDSSEDSEPSELDKEEEAPVSRAPKDEEDDEDAALERRRAEKAAAKAEGDNPCPSGHKFGVEWGDYPECKKDACPAYKKCGVAG